MAHVFTGWAVPVSIGDDHQRGAETGRVERRITLVTQQQLQQHNGHQICGTPLDFTLSSSSQKLCKLNNYKGLQMHGL